MAIREYRFDGFKTNGEPVRGTVFAPHQRAARKRVDELSGVHEFQLDRIEQRHTYLYKVRHQSGEVVKGQQKAYAAEEVEQFKAGIIRNKQKQGLYVDSEFGVVFVGTSLFRATIDLPANVPVGPLKTRVHLFREGILLDTFESEVQLAREGVGRYLYNFAIGYPLIVRLRRGHWTWSQRNAWDMVFTVALALLLLFVFLVPLFILVDQAIDTSWVEVKESGSRRYAEATGSDASVTLTAQSGGVALRKD